MKVAGFSFIRNASKLDYPIVEAIRSILPICDEFVIAVGNSDDDTLALIQQIDSPKIRIIETVWDDSLRAGGRVLAVETDKAYAQISKEMDWAFYIQGDEIIHEKYLPVLQEAMQKWLPNKEVDGLLLNYLHFYGSYDYVGDSRKWYRKEIRIIRANREDIYAYRDAQGFRKNPNQKLNVKPVDAFMYHYGWVRDPRKQTEKHKAFHRMWNQDEYQASAEDFDYSGIDSLSFFKDTHPAVMQGRIDGMNWKFDFDISKKKYTPRVAFLMWLEKITGWRIGEYKNYKII